MRARTHTSTHTSTHATETARGIYSETKQNSFGSRDSEPNLLPSRRRVCNLPDRRRLVAVAAGWAPTGCCGPPPPSASALLCNLLDGLPLSCLPVVNASQTCSSSRFGGLLGSLTFCSRRRCRSRPCSHPAGRQAQPLLGSCLLWATSLVSFDGPSFVSFDGPSFVSFDGPPCELELLFACSSRVPAGPVAAGL